MGIVLQQAEVESAESGLDSGVEQSGLSPIAFGRTLDAWFLFFASGTGETAALASLAWVWWRAPVYDTSSASAASAGRS
jgi:hypothetical protein